MQRCSSIFHLLKMAAKIAFIRQVNNLGKIKFKKGGINWESLEIGISKRLKLWCYNFVLVFNSNYLKPNNPIKFNLIASRGIIMVKLAWEL